MRGQILRALVRLGLDDPPDLPAGGTGVDQVHAEQVARDERAFRGRRRRGEGGWLTRASRQLLYKRRSVGLKPRLLLYSAFGQCADTCITSSSAVPAAASSDLTLMRMKSSELPFS